MIDWLTLLIIGIVVMAIGWIIRYVTANPVLQKLGYALIIIGAVIIVIAIILLIVSLAGMALMIAGPSPAL